MIWLLFIISFFSGYLLSQEYLYPVTTDGSFLYLIHQKIDSKTLLMRYDMENRLMEPVLCPFYYPTHVQLLPDKKGLSFIDQGILKIFYFSKRSAMALDAGFPFEAVSYQWINDNTVAIVASNGSFFFIIVYSLFDSQSKIIDKENVHFYLPIVHQKDFCYIMRDAEKQFLVRDSDKLKHLLPFSYSVLKLYSFRDNLLGLIYVEKVNHLLNFNIVELKTGNTLFSFSLPDYLEFCEGLEPMFPKIYEDSFYYSDVCVENDKTQWFMNRYVVETSKQDVLGSVGVGHCCFSPLVVGQTIFYGDVLGPMTNLSDYPPFFLCRNKDILIFY